MKNKTKFLKRICPYKLMDEYITWGEMIAIISTAVVGVIIFFMFFNMCYILTASKSYVGGF